MNRFALLRDESGETADIDPVRACSDSRRTGSFLWLHLDGREHESFEWLRDHGALPETVAYALTAVETRPRCEPIDDGALINLRGPATEGEEGDPLVSIRMWAEAGRVISLSFRKLDGLPEIVDRMRAGKLKDPGDMIAMLAVMITKRIDPIVTELGDLVDDCESDLEAGNAFETRRQIAKARSHAIVYRRFVVPQREALARLAGLEVDWLEDADRLHLREAADRFSRMAEELESVRERSALIHEQLTDLRSELIERRALGLSIVALVFLPLTFLTGLLGMNVEGIPYAHEPWAFAAVCGLSLVVALLIASWFIVRHWFNK